MGKFKLKILLIAIMLLGSIDIVNADETTHTHGSPILFESVYTTSTADEIFDNAPRSPSFELIKPKNFKNITWSFYFGDENCGSNPSGGDVFDVVIHKNDLDTFTLNPGIYLPSEKGLYIICSQFEVNGVVSGCSGMENIQNNPMMFAAGLPAYYSVLITYNYYNESSSTLQSPSACYRDIMFGNGAPEYNDGFGACTATSCGFLNPHRSAFIADSDDAPPPDPDSGNSGDDGGNW